MEPNDSDEQDYWRKRCEEYMVKLRELEKNSEYTRELEVLLVNLEKQIKELQDNLARCQLEKECLYSKLTDRVDPEELSHCNGRIDVSNHCLHHPEPQPSIPQQKHDQANGQRQFQHHQQHSLDGSGDGHEIQREEVSLSCHASNYEEEQLENESVIIELDDEPGSLGVHILPCEDGGGLIIESILRGGRVDKDGRLGVGDQIIEVNCTSLLNVTFDQAQMILKNASLAPKMCLRVIKCAPVDSGKEDTSRYSSNNSSEPSSSSSPPPHQQPQQQPPPPPLLPKPSFNRSETEPGMIEVEPRTPNQTKVATVTSTKRLTTTIPITSISRPVTTVTARKLGRKYHIRLVKGNDGLGFSIATKDNPAGDSCPIYIKNIFPKGSAIQDGTLRSGDRLIQVNGIEMADKTHEEVVAMLKNIEVGSSVDLIIARQEPDLSPSPSLPRPLPVDKGGDIPSGRPSEVLTFEIPSNDTSSAGLGISTKGRTVKSPQGCEVDLGLFVGHIINGGAAFKDGRLKVNDQFISVNRVPLLGLPNAEAYKLLQNAFKSGDPANPHIITVTVARRVQSPESDNNRDAGEPRSSTRASSDSTEEDVNVTIFSTDDNNKSNNEDLDISTSSYKSCENTVIFKPKEISTPSNKQLDDHHFNLQHPVSDRLLGRTPSIRDRVMPSALVNGDLSPNRSDVHIEDDTEETSYNESITQTTPKSIAESDDVDGYEATEDTNLLKPVESVTSLVDNDGEIVFHRDGFGRQSISEKRHATLNAKNTDTYQRNKKAKEERERERQRLKEEYGITDEAPLPTTPVTSRIESEQNQSQHQTQPKELAMPIKPSRGERSGHKNAGLFSPKCCWSCQSPGSCPYHVGPNITSRSGTSRVGPNLGLKKSSSLESLQTKIQELQKEQLENREGNPFAGPRPATLKVSRSRTTNESFRAAVDRSYDSAAAAQQTMETLAEEESENGQSLNVLQQQQQLEHHQEQQHLIQQHHRLHYHNGDHISSKPSEAAISLAGTQCTTTTGTSSQMTASDYREDDVALIKRKGSGSKKGLIRTLFKFGSSKKPKSESSSKTGKKEYEDLNKMRARQAAQQEQERIQEHIRKFKEQQLHQQHQTQVKSPIGLPSNQDLNQVPLTHFKSDPVSPFSQALQSPPPTGQQAMKLNAHHAALYDSTRIGNHMRTASGRMTGSGGRHYPVEIRERIDDRYERNRLHPHQRGEPDVMHARANSYDVCKENLDRPGSRVAIGESPGKYSHYVNYREMQQQLEHYQMVNRGHGMLQKQASYPSTSGTYSQYNSGPSELPPMIKSTNSGDNSVDRSSMQLRRLPTGNNQLTEVATTNKDARRAKRPISSYEFGNMFVMSNKRDEMMNPTLPGHQKNVLPGAGDYQSGVQYGYIQRNAANFSSLPRHPATPSKVNTVPSNRVKQAIYHQSSGVKIYGSQYHNGIDHSQSASHSSSMYPNNPLISQYAYGSYRLRRDPLPPGSNI